MTFRAIAVFTAFEMKPSVMIGRIQTGGHEPVEMLVTFAINAANPKAREIGTARFAQAVKAVGLTFVQDTDELLNKEFIVDYAHSADSLNATGFYVKAITPTIQTRIEYRQEPPKPNWLQRLRKRIADRLNPVSDEDEYGYEDWIDYNR